MFAGVPKSMPTLCPDLRSNSGTMLVITALAPPVEMTFISAASTWVPRAKANPMITPVHFIPALLCRHAHAALSSDALRNGRTREPSAGPCLKTIPFRGSRLRRLRLPAGEGVADGSSQFLTDDHCICAIIILFIGLSLPVVGLFLILSRASI